MILTTTESNPRLNNYFLFYALTFFGSSLTAVSSFLMIERLTGSIGQLGLTLGLKTAVAALVSPALANLVVRVGSFRSFCLSQFIGLFLLVPLFVGVQSKNTVLFLFGICVGSIPNLIFNIVGTGYLKSISADEGAFRSNQGRLQLVSSITFTSCAVLAPLLLRAFDYNVVILIDGLSYVLCLLYIGLMRRAISQADENFESLASKTRDASKEESDFHFWSKSSILLALSVFSAYCLKGLPPLISGSSTFNDYLPIEQTLRQSIWSCEAIAGIAAGLSYKRLYSFVTRARLFEIGLINSVCLGIVAISTTLTGLAVAVLFLAYTMTLAFMKVRDDYLIKFETRVSTLKAIGYVNLVSNVVMTVSPIALGWILSHFGAQATLIVFGGIQILLYSAIKMIRRSEAKNV